MVAAIAGGAALTGIAGAIDGEDPSALEWLGTTAGIAVLVIIENEFGADSIEGTFDPGRGRGQTQPRPPGPPPRRPPGQRLRRPPPRPDHVREIDPTRRGFRPPGAGR
jgi:hypothetical protein